MSPLAAAFQPAILGAAGLYLLLVVLVEALAARLGDALRESGPSVWLVTHVYLPLGRAAALATFVLAAYPALFGLDPAPPLASVLAGDGRTTALVNLSFVASLLLPLAGVPRPWVLPLQGIAVSALLLHWSAAAVGGEAALWPGTGPAAGVVLLAFAGHLLARLGAVALGPRLDAWWNTQGAENIVYDGLLMLCQLPALLTYTLAAGAALR